MLQSHLLTLTLSTGTVIIRRYDHVARSCPYTSLFVNAGLFSIGVDMGLWLTINLEQYDALEGYDEEAGIRVSFGGYQ